MKKSSKKRLSNVLIIISEILVLIGICILGYGYANSVKAERDMQKFEYIYIDEKQDEDDITSTAYKAIDNCVAWLKVPDTKISYPIMQKENSPLYYLHKDAYGNYSYSGTPFLDERCDINSSQNLIIYGHNMRDGTMFSRLMKYNDTTYCKAHDKLYLVVNGEKVEYQLYAVAKVNDDDIWYTFIDNENEDMFNNLISHIKKESLYTSDTDVKYGDSFITLSTCEYTRENGRLIIIGTRSESNV